MRIEMLETIKHDTPSGFLFEKGEQRQVDEEIGRLFCAKGWATDLDGNVPTGQRSTGNVELDVNDAPASSSSEGR